MAGGVGGLGPCVGFSMEGQKDGGLTSKPLEHPGPDIHLWRAAVREQVWGAALVRRGGKEINWGLDVAGGWGGRPARGAISRKMRRGPRAFEEGDGAGSRGCRHQGLSDEAVWRRPWVTADPGGLLPLGPGSIPGEGRGCGAWPCAGGWGAGCSLGQVPPAPPRQAVPLRWESGPGWRRGRGIASVSLGGLGLLGECWSL